MTVIASLHRTTNNHILTASSMFDFCKNEIKGVKFYFISKESNLKIRSEMEHRYTLARTLPGTRSYHNFTPKVKQQLARKSFLNKKNIHLFLISKLTIVIKKTCLHKLI